MIKIECPFCTKTTEDFFLQATDFASIYNISPILPGHSLVIPKTHKESVFELSEEELAEFISLGRKTAKLLTHIFNTDAFDLAIQEKEAAGQSVAHLHMHIVPRKIGDLPNPGDWYQELEKNIPGDIDTFKRFRLTEKQLNEITERLRNAGKLFH